MKKLIIITGLLVLVLFGSSRAQGGFGLGIILGEPTGVSGKLWLSKTDAIDGAAAWSFESHEAFHLHLDYLMHSFNLIKVEKGKLPIYYGIGGRIRFLNNDEGVDHGDGDDDIEIGLRIPVGLEYLFEKAPLDVFLEIAPILDLVPDTEASFNGGIGVRYFFK